MEGRFVNGSIDGYARKFDADASCKVGYWKPVEPPKLKKGEEEPIYLPFSGPYGKWTYFSAKDSTICPEGFYLGKYSIKDKSTEVV